MSDPEENFMTVNRATWRDHFRAAFFPRRQFTDLEEYSAKLPGWFKTIVILDIDWKDKLRILLSGRARIEIESRCDVGDIGTVISDTAFNVLSPFDAKEKP